MLTSIFIYIGLLSLMILSLKLNNLHLYPINANKTFPMSYLLIPSLMFAFIFGCRYNVGVDYYTYYTDYLYYWSNREIEPGFLLIKETFKNNGLHFALYFGFIAFIQIFFFMMALRKRAYLYPSILLVLFLSCIELGWMNGIRQSIATCIFVYATTLIDDKKPIKFIMAILLAMQFHNSAIILLPIYFITYIPILKNKWLSIGVYLLALFINTLPVERFDVLFTKAADLLGYGDIYDSEMALVELENNGTGLGRIILNTIFLILILYSNKLKHFFKNDERWFNIMYNLFIIGMFGNMAFNKCVMLLRPFGYFRIFWAIMAGILIYYFTKKRTKPKDIVYYILIGLITLTFIANMLNGKSNYMEFHFFWENLIYQK